VSERDLRTIVAVFFDPRAAYDYEQNLIAEMWGRPSIVKRVRSHQRYTSFYERFRREEADRST